MQQMNARSLYKAEKGLIRVNATIGDGAIKEIRITGDFFMVPENAIERLEQLLTGKRFERKSVEAAVKEFYAEGVETPYVRVDDFVNAVMGVTDDAEIDR